jgi:hypothetical protein
VAETFETIYENINGGSSKMSNHLKKLFDDKIASEVLRHYIKDRKPKKFSQRISYFVFVSGFMEYLSENESIYAKLKNSQVAKETLPQLAYILQGRVFHSVGYLVKENTLQWCFENIVKPDVEKFVTEVTLNGDEQVNYFEYRENIPKAMVLKYFVDDNTQLYLIKNSEKLGLSFLYQELKYGWMNLLRNTVSEETFKNILNSDNIEESFLKAPKKTSFYLPLSNVFLLYPKNISANICRWVEELDESKRAFNSPGSQESELIARQLARTSRNSETLTKIFVNAEKKENLKTLIALTSNPHLDPVLGRQIIDLICNHQKKTNEDYDFLTPLAVEPEYRIEKVFDIIRSQVEKQPVLLHKIIVEDISLECYKKLISSVPNRKTIAEVLESPKKEGLSACQLKLLLQFSDINVSILSHSKEAADVAKLAPLLDEVQVLKIWEIFAKWLKPLESEYAAVILDKNTSVYERKHVFEIVCNLYSNTV